jgi:hypothetical protein
MGVKSSSVPGDHSKQTKLLGFYADLKLVSKVEEARGDLARSQFLREAVVEYMVSRGVPVPKELRNAPDRTGKGGPKQKVSYRPARRTNSKPVSAAAKHAKLLGVAEEKGQHS